MTSSLIAGLDSMTNLINYFITVFLSESMSLAGIVMVLKVVSLALVLVSLLVSLNIYQYFVLVCVFFLLFDDDLDRNLNVVYSFVIDFMQNRHLEIASKIDLYPPIKQTVKRFCRCSFFVNFILLLVTTQPFLILSYLSYFCYVTVHFIIVVLSLKKKEVTIMLFVLFKN